jgi:glutamine amidotransferase
VHSFHMQPKNKEDILTQTSYGYDFASAVKKDNVYGVQFHPEKSHKYGMQLLSNFSKI